LNYAGERPVWADVFGSLLAEAQAKAAVYDNDYLLDHFARMNRSIILKADRFSTVSGPQKNELIGQLGVFSRLKVSTFGYDFVRSIPCGVQDREFPPPADPFTGRENGDFIVLWSGGFNTWTDVKCRGHPGSTSYRPAVRSRGTTRKRTVSSWGWWRLQSTVTGFT